MILDRSSTGGRPPASVRAGRSSMRASDPDGAASFAVRIAFLLLLALVALPGVAFASPRPALRLTGMFHLHDQPVASPAMVAEQGIGTIRRSPRVFALQIADGFSAINIGYTSVPMVFGAGASVPKGENPMIGMGETAISVRDPPLEGQNC